MGCYSSPSKSPPPPPPPPPPQHFITSTHLYSWVERGTVRVQCLPRLLDVIKISKSNLRKKSQDTLIVSHLYSCNIRSKLDVCLLQMRSPGGEEILTKLLIKITWKGTNHTIIHTIIRTTLKTDWLKTDWLKNVLVPLGGSFLCTM